jgi:hypothetical protein
MKLETNENGKIVLIKKSTMEEVEFDYQVDAREAILQTDKNTGDSCYIVPETKKKKFSAPKNVESVEEKVKKPGLKVGPGRKPKEIIKDNDENPESTNDDVKDDDKDSGDEV